MNAAMLHDLLAAGAWWTLLAVTAGWVAVVLIRRTPGADSDGGRHRPRPGALRDQHPTRIPGYMPRHAALEVA